MRDDYTHQTPGEVTGAVAGGAVALPFLAVYAVIFLIHGFVRPVHPPDITSSQTGEGIAGIIAAALFALLTVALLWFLSGVRRWPLAILELGVAAASVDFLVDPTKGGRAIAALMLLGAVVSLVLMFAPKSWWWLNRGAPRWLVALAAVVQRRQPEEEEDEPHTSAEDVRRRRRYVGRRRRDSHEDATIPAEPAEPQLPPGSDVAETEAGVRS